jgi:hypothetical protein
MAWRLDCGIANRALSPKERRDEDEKICKREQKCPRCQLCTGRLDSRPSMAISDPQVDAGHVIHLNLMAMQRILQRHQGSGQENGVSAAEVLI